MKLELIYYIIVHEGEKYSFKIRFAINDKKIDLHYFETGIDFKFKLYHGYSYDEIRITDIENKDLPLDEISNIFNIYLNEFKSKNYLGKKFQYPVSFYKHLSNEEYKTFAIEFEPNTIFNCDVTICSSFVTKSFQEALILLGKKIRKIHKDGGTSKIDVCDMEVFTEYLFIEQHKTYYYGFIDNENAAEIQLVHTFETEFLIDVFDEFEMIFK